jgi:hypothetical protein
MKRSCSLFVLAACAICFVASLSFGQELKYFPETGPQAIHQRALDVSNNAVVLMVALQPGYEDLNLLARLRLGLGARTFVLYWTNGEGTPSDAEGASPGLLAADRREEGFHAARALGAQVYYLNLPDPGVGFRQGGKMSPWNADSILHKIVPMIRSFGPDVIVVGGDLRGDTVRSVRQRTVTRMILAGVKQAAEGKTDSLQAGPWRVERVLVQTGADPANKQEAYDKVHPLWQKTYRSIASEAADAYRTLRIQLPAWLSRGDRTYTQIFPTAGPAPKLPTSGVPALTPRLKTLSAVVKGSTGKEINGVRKPSLEAVAHAIDSVNIFIARNGSRLQAGELRVISLWKNTLEDLRCSLLGVSIICQPSDSLVTQGQLFYLRFAGFSSLTSKTHTSILFPGVLQKRWGVNESAKYQYDFASPQEYRIITPTPMDYNFPGSQLGILRPFARTRFSFLINHQDSLPGRDFTYRGEVLLRSGPRRTFELLTPAVRALEDEPVVYRLVNISRDAFEGTMVLQDPILNAATKRVSLSRKDEVLVDTLLLSFKRPAPSGTSTVTLSLSGMGGTIPVVIRKFDAAIDSSARIMLLSPLKDSPLTQGMHRLRLPYVLAHKIQPDSLERANVLVVDRDVLAGMKLDPGQSEAVREWVQRGGHLVVFPQGSAPDRGSAMVPWARFESGPLSAPDDSVVVSSGDALLAGPNLISGADWTNWVVSRAMWSLRVSGEATDETVVRTAKGQDPLLVTRKIGKGRITLVALDIPSQLANLHPGAHRLLGNLLKAER